MKQDIPWWKSLRPLRIPEGWEVVWSKLEDIEPEGLPEEDPAWLRHFTEDIVALQANWTRRWHKQTQKQTISIDLGWYPDGDPAGAYTLQAVLNGNWEEPLLKLETRSTQEAVDTMERWLFQVFVIERWVEDPAQFRKKWS